MSKFVGTEEELEQLIADETYLTAEECLTFGLCTEILEEIEEPEEPEEPETSIKETLFNKYRKDVKAGDKRPALFNAFQKQNLGGNADEE